MRSWPMIVEELEMFVNVVNHMWSVFGYAIEYMKSFLWVDRIYGVFVFCSAKNHSHENDFGAPHLD